MGILQDTSLGAYYSRLKNPSTLQVHFLHSTYPTNPNAKIFERLPAVMFIDGKIVISVANSAQYRIVSIGPNFVKM